MAGVTPVKSFRPEVHTKANNFVQEAVQKRQLDKPGQVDQQQLSEELMDEVGKAGVVDPMDQSSGLEAMLGALGQNFLDQKLGPADQGGAAGKQDQKTETIVDWTPKVKKGEIIGAHAPIGEVVVRERTEGGANQPVGAAKGGAKKAKAGGGAAPAPKAKDPSKAVGKGAAPADENKADEDEQGADSVKLSSESQQMAQKMAAQGTQVPGVTEPSKSKQAGPKQAGEKIVEQGEITTRCGGVSQTVEVEGQGRLNEQSFLRTYRKLDDMPDDLMVGFKNKTGQEAVEEYSKKLAKGDITRPLTAQQIDQLRFPSGSQK